mgnify:CR=1 FL=1
MKEDHVLRAVLDMLKVTDAFVRNFGIAWGSIQRAWQCLEEQGLSVDLIYLPRSWFIAFRAIVQSEDPIYDAVASFDMKGATVTTVSVPIDLYGPRVENARTRIMAPIVGLPVDHYREPDFQSLPLMHGVVSRNARSGIWTVSSVERSTETTSDTLDLALDSFRAELGQAAVADVASGEDPFFNVRTSPHVLTRNQPPNGVVATLGTVRHLPDGLDFDIRVVWLRDPARAIRELGALRDEAFTAPGRVQYRSSIIQSP